MTGADVGIAGGWLPLLVKASYLVAATLFLLGLQRMASPRTARSGIRWAGAGMVLATVATFALPGLHNLGLIVLAHADTTLQRVIGFMAVALGAGNAAGGYVVTERMLEMFKSSKQPKKA